MSGLKSLAKDTVIYGSSSIIGKFLNWMLVPYYVRMLSSQAEYGIVTNIYGYTALLTVMLTYGLETGFFRFSNKNEENPTTVYTTTLTSIGISSLLFLFLSLGFIHPISSTLGYEGCEEYLGIMFFTVGIDAFMSIPFAYLRYKKRPIRFATIKMLFVFLNILFNIFFLSICPSLYKNNPDMIAWFYRPNYGVGYIFIANLMATFIQLLFLFPEIFGIRYGFKWSLLKQILRYSLPLLILGIAGIMNQTIDKIIFPYLFHGNLEEAQSQLGIYGACSKIAIVMVLFTQAFRFAYEPFIFARNKAEDNKKNYADVMKYFIIFSLFIFLTVMFYMDIIKYFFIKPPYYEGLRVVPILMMGLLFFGIYFNLSLWYKLTDKTNWGAYFSFIGFIVLMLIMIVFIPAHSYMACAWAGFFCNLVMMLISYFVGQKKYPIQYDLKTIGFYFMLFLSLYIPAMYLTIENDLLRLGFRTILLFIFVAVVIKKDLPLGAIPYINKFVK